MAKTPRRFIHGADYIAAPLPSDKHIMNLYHAIEHGNDEHRAWLKEALFAWFHAKPVPPVRGSIRERDVTHLLFAEPPVNSSTNDAKEEEARKGINSV